MTYHAASTTIDTCAELAQAGAVASDELKMRRFLDWMREHGATFPSMSIKVEPGIRQTFATRPLAAGELVAHIPPHLTITPQIARESETGKLIAADGSDVDDLDYIAAFLLQIKRTGGFWKPYVDVLPADYSEHPLCYSKADLDELKGSYILNGILSSRARHVYRYDQLPSCLKENGMTREEFTWAKCVVLTRLHGRQLAGKLTEALVPLSDMFNHATENNTDWTLAEDGYFIKAEHQIPAGAALFERYGRCNARLLHDYGFCLDDNPDNVAEIRLQPLPTDHPFYEHAKRLGGMQWNKRVFHVPASYSSTSAKAMFSYLRLTVGASPLLKDLPIHEGEEHKVPPISYQDEIAVLTALATACDTRLRQFSTILEEDQALLTDGALRLNLRNAVRVRHDEKVILQYFLDLAQTVLPVLQHAPHDIPREAVPGKAYADYFADLAMSLAGC